MTPVLFLPKSGSIATVLVRLNQPFRPWEPCSIQRIVLPPTQEAALESAIMSTHGVPCWLFLALINITILQFMYVKIIDFYPLLEDDDNEVTGKSSTSNKVGSCSNTKGRPFSMSQVILSHETAMKEWKRVQYNVAWTDRFLRRSGTCSTAVPDAIGFVLSRIEFLQENGHVLPHYDELLANCECVAVWCKTGCLS